MYVGRYLPSIYLPTYRNPSSPKPTASTCHTIAEDDDDDDDDDNDDAMSSLMTTNWPPPSLTPR